MEHNDIYSKKTILKPKGDSIKTVDSFDENDELNMSQILNLEKKLQNNFYKIIAFLYLGNKNNKTENEQKFYDENNDEITKIIQSLTFNEKQLLTNIGVNGINNLYKYYCNAIKKKKLSLIENFTCANDNVIDEIYMNSEFSDKILNCPFDDFDTNFDINFENYLKLKSCK